MFYTSSTIFFENGPPSPQGEGFFCSSPLRKMVPISFDYGAVSACAQDDSIPTARKRTCAQDDRGAVSGMGGVGVFL